MYLVLLEMLWTISFIFQFLAQKVSTGSASHLISKGFRYLNLAHWAPKEWWDESLWRFHWMYWLYWYPRHCAQLKTSTRGCLNFILLSPEFKCFQLEVTQFNVSDSHTFFQKNPRNKTKAYTEEILIPIMWEAHFLLILGRSQGCLQPLIPH